MDAQLALDSPLNLKEFEAKAADATRLLKMLANEHRLLILCRLAGAGEMSVGTLARDVGLGQSALSQHLGKLRDEGVVTTRRQAQTVYYRVANPQVAGLLGHLKGMYCP